MKEECKVETYMESRSSIGMISQGYSEVDKASLHATFPDLSPIRISTPAKRSPGLSPIMSCGQQNKSFGTGFSSPKQGVASGGELQASRIFWKRLESSCKTRSSSHRVITRFPTNRIVVDIRSIRATLTRVTINHFDHFNVPLELWPFGQFLS